VTEIVIAVSGLILVLMLDLICIAVRASFTQTNYARLLALREVAELKINRGLALLPVLSRLRAGLNLTLVLERFALAGLVFRVMSFGWPSLSPIVVIAVWSVGALLVFWLEYGVERAVSHDPELWAIRLTTLARVWMVVTYPLLLPLTFSKGTQESPETSSAIMEDEVKTLVDAGQKEGTIEKGERRMIYSIFELGDTLVREIMVPRIDILAVEVQTPLPEAVDLLLKYGHSRVPVFEETVDKTLGLLYAKDLLRLWREGNLSSSLRNLLRPAYFVPEAKKADELLAEMQAERIHMAIVVDEYGGVAGLVTLEDIIEEILGEIQDEYDQSEEASYQERKDGEYVFLGRIDLDDFNEIMGSELPKDEADSLGGYIYNRLGRVPSVGETLRNDNLQLTVEQVSARRIRKVSARWLPPDTDSEKENDSVDG
jgi:putative hemolysin